MYHARSWAKEQPAWRGEVLNWHSTPNIKGVQYSGVWPRSATGILQGLLYRQESVRVILRYEVNELLADARLRVSRNQRRILCNTSRISWSRERCRCRQIVCRSRMDRLL